jgi:DNA polymerase I-like protein with 3'-5' exonuclease and polymerase domains
MLIRTTAQFFEMLHVLDSLEEHERIAIDTETTGLRPWGDTVLRGISLYMRGQTYYIPVSHPKSWNVHDIGMFTTAVKYSKAVNIFHNANYDRAILERNIGLEPKEYHRDTVLLAWLLDENRTKSLKKLGEIFFGLDASAEQKALKQLMRGESKAEAYKRWRAEGLSVADSRDLSVATKRPWGDLTAEEIAPYAEQDAKLTYDLYDRLVSDKEYAMVAPAVSRMHLLQDVVYRMVKRGVQIDPERTIWHRNEAIVQAARIQEKFFDVNLDSPQQLAKLIYEDWGLKVTERTESGGPSTSRTALEALAGKHAGLDDILAYRRWKKAQSTYYDPFLSAMDEDARIHPNVNIVGTVTGRFSYSDPNLQTIPRGGTISGVKECFVARRGKRLVSYDLKQAELRFMASLAGESALIGALTEGRDLYQEVAESIGTSRQIGKGLVLSWPYGVGPVKFAKTAGITTKESRAIIAGFEDTYSALSSTMFKLSQHAEFYGRMPLLGLGRFRRFTSPSLQWPVPSYTALNAACQGGVADFMGDVMIHIEDYADAMGCELVLQVHDALVFEVPDQTTAHQLCTELHRVGDECNPLDMPLIWEMKEGV